jgi:hypothetical protein
VDDLRTVARSAEDVSGASVGARREDRARESGSMTLLTPTSSSGNGSDESDGFSLAATSARTVAGVAAIPLIGRIAPSVRDAIFRRLLAIADITAAAGGLAIIGLTTGRGLAAASLASVPLIVVIAKITGRYDHDDVVVRKSTTDEIPELLGLAAVYALAWSVSCRLKMLTTMARNRPRSAGRRPAWMTWRR